MPRKKRTYAFIDASNLFYGGEKSLGWKIDYQKLLIYIQERYGVNKIYYYGGIELEGKTVTILARAERTAREIRQLAGSSFRDFNFLREILRFEQRFEK